MVVEQLKMDLYKQGRSSILRPGIQNMDLNGVAV
jgi:hypothetical protein